MKQNKKIICILAVCGCVLYFLGTINIYLGSNSEFYNTAFDYNQTYWHNAEYDISGKVCVGDDYNYIKLTDEKLKKNYILLCLDDFTVECYETDSTNKIDEENFIQRISMQSYKRWGSVYKFKLLDVNHGAVSRNLVFKKVIVEKNN